ncbi:MAG: RDD family protein [Candidatus Riflebacteria bacterium]|nr:RDD family protein [Candidatus Riflebacteria bacterium]
MGAEQWNIELQGVTPDLLQANGSYDTIEFKNVTPKRIAEVLQIISQLCPPDSNDVCWPHLIVRGPRGDHLFSIYDDSGQIYCDDPEGAVSIGQAILMITGRLADFKIDEPKIAATAVSTAVAGMCSNCKAKLEPDEAFCGGCGQAVSRSVAPPPPPAKPKASKKAPIDEQTYNEMIALMAKPLSLREYREKYPYLMKGPKGPEFRSVIDAMFRTDPPPEVHTRLTMPPRDWGIRKPGSFRRMLTLLVDFPVLLFIIVAGANMGKDAGIDSDSLMAGIMAFSWFIGAFVGYYTVFEIMLGATPGGLLMGLRVVDDYGNSAGAWVSISRMFAKIFWILGIVAMVLSAERSGRRFPGQRVSLPGGEVLEPLDFGEVVIN